jgi:hypothetical protein
MSPWTPPTIQASDSIASRVEVVQQGDSPIHLTAIDLHGYDVVVTPTSFDVNGRVRVKLRNVSDRVIDAVTIEVKVGTKNGTVGSSGTLRGHIDPNGMGEIQVASGHGSGTVPEGEVRIAVLVDTISFGGCTYRPSQLWRTEIGKFR